MASGIRYFVYLWCRKNYKNYKEVRIWEFSLSEYSQNSKADTESIYKYIIVRFIRTVSNPALS